MGPAAEALDRREFVRRVSAGSAVLAGPSVLGSLAGCAQPTSKTFDMIDNATGGKCSPIYPINYNHIFQSWSETLEDTLCHAQGA